MKGNKMKKHITKIVIFVICLTLALVSAALADGSDPFYTADFSENADGWCARSMGGARLGATGGRLLITKRMGDWSGPAREFDLKAGQQYWLCADVMHLINESVTFRITLAQDLHSADSLELGTGVVSSGSRGIVYGTFTPETDGPVLLAVETVSQPTKDFYLYDFQVLTEDPLKLSDVYYEGELPSLRELCGGRFDIGTCMSGADARNSARTDLILRHYSIITPENELKPDSVLDVQTSRKLAKEDDTAVAVHFNAAQPILDFARDNHLRVHGHVLVWHSQTPEEFFHVGYNSSAPYVSREVMLARLDHYICQVFEYMDENYPGLFVSWDVANECVADGSTSLRASNWTKVVGQDFVARAFEIADRYAPDDVILCYNDYSTPYEPKLTGITNLLASLKAEGHIDGYGFQAHYSNSEPSLQAIRKAFDRISALGLRLRVSELDIKTDGNYDAARALQADRYGELMRLFLSYDMEAIEVWGVCDGTSWISSSYPLPFDAGLRPKPAFFAMAEALTEGN